MAQNGSEYSALPPHKLKILFFPGYLKHFYPLLSIGHKEYLSLEKLFFENVICKCQEFVDTINNTGKYPNRKHSKHDSEIKKLSQKIFLTL